MTPREAVALCRFTAACCPAQKFDEYTPDAWGLILEGIRFEDAKLAIVEIKKRSTWVDPSDIIREVKKVRAKRIDEHGPITPPADLDPIDEQAWMAAAIARVGDGEVLHDVRGELKPRDMKQLTGAIRRGGEPRRPEIPAGPQVSDEHRKQEQR